jgi:hypothetical protein
MTYLKQILYFSTAALLFASCASYGVISDNDVYLQKPAAIDLTDDQQDITSFNAYKAGRQGAFQNGDPRLRNTNASIFIASSNPFAFNNSMFSPYYGYNDPFMWNRPYGMYNSCGAGFGNGWGYGYGYGHGYGNGFNNMCGNFGFYNGYQYGSLLSPHYGHNFYGINYIGPNSNNSWSNNSGNSSFFYSGSNNQFYGQRSPLSGNSRRSSAHPETLKNQTKKVNQTASTNFPSYNKVQNRRTVSSSEREYVRPNVNTNRNISRTNDYNSSGRNVNTSSTNQRRVTSSSNTNRSRSFTPSNTARSSGTVNRSNVDRRTSGSYNSSSNTRRGSYSSSGNNGNRGSSYSSPQRSSGSSYNGSSGSSSRSTGSGSSSSRGSSSSSGRR